MKRPKLYLLIVGLFSLLLMQSTVCPISRAQQALKSFNVSPSAFEQGNEYHLTIKSTDCKADLTRTDLIAPPESGINVEVAVGVSACTMVARVVVSQYAPGGPVALRITKDDATLGFVNVVVARNPTVDPPSSPTSPNSANSPTSPKSQRTQFDQLVATPEKFEAEPPPFETSGKTPMIINWAKGPIRGDFIRGTEFYYEGIRFCVLTINNVSVATALQVNKKDIAVILHVENKSKQNIDVVPSRFVLARDLPTPKVYEYIPFEKIAVKLTRDAHRAAFWLALAGAFATRTTTTRSTTTGSVSGFADSMGSLSGFVGGTFVHSTYSGNSSFLGNYSQSTTTTTTRPDYYLRNLYIQEGQERIAQGEQAANRILSSAFKANTLIPGRFMSGYIYFTRTDSPELVLQIPIGNYIFAMPFRVR